MFNNTDYRLKSWIDNHLPADKKEYSRDAVEILLRLLWEEAKKAEANDSHHREMSERYGDW